MRQVIRKHVSGAIQQREAALDTFGRNQLQIARDSMVTFCQFVAVCGFPNHYEAARTIHNLTGAIVGIDSDCTCLHPTTQGVTA